MYKFATLLFAVSCLLAGGCSSIPVNLTAGVTPAADASRCVSLGSQMGLALQVHRTNRFLVVSDSGSSSAAAGQSMEQIADRFYASFVQAGFSVTQPSEKLVCVVLDSYHDLDTYGRMADGIEASWMGGYYSYRTNRLRGFSRARPGASGHAGIRRVPLHRWRTAILPRAGPASAG